MTKRKQLIEDLAIALVYQTKKSQEFEEDNQHLRHTAGLKAGEYAAIQQEARTAAGWYEREKYQHAETLERLVKSESDLETLQKENYELRKRIRDIELGLKEVSVE